VASVLLAGALGALAPATNATAAASTQISSCPYTISAPGHYVLAADLTCLSTGISIDATDVNLTLNGHTLRINQPSFGISVLAGETGVRITGPGTITGFNINPSFGGFGVLLARLVKDSKVSGLTVTGNTKGIFLAGGATGNTINDNTATGNVFGIQLVSGAIGNTINDNTATGNGTDLFDGNSGCDNNTWKDNIFANANPASCIH
jgi:parallel beta-helix repeat protein